MKDLKIGYNTIVRLEEYDDSKYSFDIKGVNIINKIIDYLDIRNVINYNNNEYLDFVLNKQEEMVNELIDNSKLDDIAKEFDVKPITISRWKVKKSIPSREHYEKMKKILQTKNKGMIG